MIQKLLFAAGACSVAKYFHYIWSATSQIATDVENLNAFYHALEEIKLLGIENAIKRNSENPDSTAVAKHIFELYSENNDESKPINHQEFLKSAADAISGVSSTSLYNYSFAHYYFARKTLQLNKELLEKIQYSFENGNFNYEALDKALAQDLLLNDLKDVASDFEINLLHIFNARYKIEKILSDEIAPELAAQIEALHSDYLNDSLYV